MAKRQQKTTPVVPATNPQALIATGLVCLLAGLGVGYYFGRQAGAGSAVPAASVPSTLSPVVNPADFVQQEAALKAALSASPSDGPTLVRLGNLYYDHGRWLEAIDYYGRALDLDPRDPNVRTDRGTAYWNLNRPDEAIAEYRKSLEVDPSHAQTLYNLGVVYLHGKNDLNEARSTWQRLLATNPDYPDRAKVEQQVAALSPQAPAAAPAGAPQGPEDLLRRMKK